LPSLSDLLKELASSNNNRRQASAQVTDQTSGTSQSGTLIEGLERVKELKKQYEALKDVVEPEPCPWWDPRSNSCILKLNHGYSCAQTKPYSQVIEVLKEAGVDEEKARQLLDRFHRLGLIAICDPVVHRRWSISTKWVILGALLGLWAASMGSALGALGALIVGILAGLRRGGVKRYGSKRIIFIL